MPGPRTRPRSWSSPTPRRSGARRRAATTGCCTARRVRCVSWGAAPAASLLFATLSPDGTRVAYVHANNVYVQSLADLSITPLTTDGGTHRINGTADWVNEEEFHLRNGLRWSPDSQHIAYWQFDTTGVKEFQLVNLTAGSYPEITSIAYPKVGEVNSACRVGVVAATGGPTRWFSANPDPRNHYIPRMEWTPDSRRVLFQQLNRLQNTNQVIAADPVTGATQELFVDRDDAWVDVMDEFHWVDGGRRFLWLSERDGWRHLYSVGVDDGQARLLTPGDHDVISLVGLDEAQGHVYFIASPEEPTRRYLYRAPLDGQGLAVRVTPAGQPGSHAYQLAPGALWAFHSCSRFGQPPTIQLIRLPDHAAVRPLAENTALRAKLAALTPVRSEFLRVPLPDGTLLDAWCLSPPDFDPAKRYRCSSTSMASPPPRWSWTAGAGITTSGMPCSPSKATWSSASTTAVRPPRVGALGASASTARSASSPRPTRPRPSANSSGPARTSTRPASACGVTVAAAP